MRLKYKMGGFSTLEVIIILVVCAVIVKLMVFQLKSINMEIVDKKTHGSAEKLFVEIERLLGDSATCEKALQGKNSDQAVTIIQQNPMIQKDLNKQSGLVFEVGKSYYQDKVVLDSMVLLKNPDSSTSPTLTQNKNKNQNQNQNQNQKQDWLRYSLEVTATKRLEGKMELNNHKSAASIKKKIPLLVRLERGQVQSCLLDSNKFDVKDDVSTAVCGYFGGVPDQVSGRCMTLEIPINKIKLCPPSEHGEGLQACPNPTLSLEQYVEAKADQILLATGRIRPGATPSPTSSLTR